MNAEAQRLAALDALWQSEWRTEANVLCVVCTGCGFTFDACHTDTSEGGYTCPVCGDRGVAPPERTAR